jgi:hypothetical protein
VGAAWQLEYFGGERFAPTPYKTLAGTQNAG